jgi:hypothetical protein
MQAKTGVARLALATGVPVIPVGHWGAQDILPYGSFKPHVIPRKTVHMLAGPPVDLSEFADKPLDTPTLRAATDKIMTEVAALVGKLRGEVPPPEPFRPAVARRKERAEFRKLSDQQAATQATRATETDTDTDTDAAASAAGAAQPTGEPDAVPGEPASEVPGP